MNVPVLVYINPKRFACIFTEVGWLDRGPWYDMQVLPIKFLQ